VGDIAFAPDGDGWFAIDLQIIGIYPKPGGVAQRDRQNGSAWNTWDMSQGLPTNQAWDIAVDQQGNVWAGTLNGLARYDQADQWTGYPTASSPLITDRIEDLEFDSHDTLWVATFQGVHRITAQGDWDTLTITDGLPSNRVSAVKTFADTVCFGTDIGIGCLDQASGLWQYFGDRADPTYPIYLPLLVTNLE
jgi:ligand-binding sensor domain-containing protein